MSYVFSDRGGGHLLCKSRMWMPIEGLRGEPIVSVFTDLISVDDYDVAQSYITSLGLVEGCHAVVVPWGLILDLLASKPKERARA